MPVQDAFNALGVFLCASELVFFVHCNNDSWELRVIPVFRLRVYAVIEVKKRFSVKKNIASKKLF